MKKIKVVVSIITAFVLCLALAGCSDSSDSSKTSGGESSSASESSSAGTQTGSFVIQLFPEYAPKTVENFINLVESGFYDGLTFHRVIDGFMAQGGDPNGDGTGGVSDGKIEGEFLENGFEKNTLSHTRGVVSMARSSDFNSASCQFFICYGDDNTSVLDGYYAAFGKVNEEGMKVVDKFLEVPRETNASGEANASPVNPITIVSAKMISDTSDGHSQVQMVVKW